MSTKKGTFLGNIQESRDAVLAVLGARPRWKGAILSHKAFEREARLSWRTIWSRLCDLEAEGLVEIVRHEVGRNNPLPNQYRLRT